MHLLRWCAAAVAVGALTGCQSFVAPPYSPDYTALDRLKATRTAQPLQKVSLGNFQPTDPNAPVNRISLRAVTMVSPRVSFAAYLQDALMQDLKEISLYDEQSDLRMAATVLRNEIDIGGFSTGEGRMSVEITLQRGSAMVLRKTYASTTSFESSFAGAVAIPRGQIEYPRLVQSLLAKVYADPEFINNLKK